VLPPRVLVHPCEGFSCVEHKSAGDGAVGLSAGRALGLDVDAGVLRVLCPFHVKRCHRCLAELPTTQQRKMLLLA